MPRYYEEGELEKQNACDGLRADLKECLMQSDCVMKVLHTMIYSYSSSRCHLVVGSLWPTLFTSSRFSHGLHLLSSRLLSCHCLHSASISALVFLVFSMVLPSPAFLSSDVAVTRPGAIPTLESESKDDSDSDSTFGIGVGIICS